MRDSYSEYMTCTKSIMVFEPKQPPPKLEDYDDPTLGKRMELQCKIQDHKDRVEQRKTRRINMFPFHIFRSL